MDAAATLTFSGCHLVSALQFEIKLSWPHNPADADAATDDDADNDIEGVHSSDCGQASGTHLVFVLLFRSVLSKHHPNTAAAAANDTDTDAEDDDTVVNCCQAAGPHLVFVLLLNFVLSRPQQRDGWLEAMAAAAAAAVLLLPIKTWVNNSVLPRTLSLYCCSTSYSAGTSSRQTSHLQAHKQITHA
jgi:hypothetical protein